MPSRRDVLAALSTAGVAALAGCSGTDEVDGRWPRAGYDERSTGYAPGVRGPGSNPTVKWTARVPDGVYASSPVLRGDRVYLGYETEPYADRLREVGLRILDAGTGEVRRDVTVASSEGEDGNNALYRDSVVYADGALYLIAFDGLHSLTPAGEERWHVSMGGGPANTIQRSAHPVVVDGIVYAPTASTTRYTDSREAVYAVDADAGEEVWRYVVPRDRFGWTFPLAHADGAVYVAALDYGVTALDTATGEEIWHASEPSVNGPPTVADGRVYASLDPDDDDREISYVVALDAETGEEIWRSRGSGTRLGRRIGAAHGRVYYREHLREFVARDAATGEEVWRYADAENVSLATPAVTDEAIYVGADAGRDGDGGIAVLNPATGVQSGFTGIGSGTNLNASIALADGLAVVNASSGRAYAFEACSLDVAGYCLF